MNRTFHLHNARRLSVGLTWLLGLALFVAACTPAAPAAPTTAPAAKAAPTTAPAAKQAAPTSAPAAKQASKPTSVEGLATYQGADRQQILEAGARAEGQLTWYTSLAGQVVELLAAGFKEKYPFIQMEVFRAAENELVTKATQEAQAGQQVFDVIESPHAAILLLREAGLLTRYHSPALTPLPDAVKSDPRDGTVSSATVRISYIGFGYNTTLIPESAVPTTHQDLLNPGLTGKLSLAGTTTGMRWAGSVLHGMGEAEGAQFLTQFATQQRPTIQQVSGKALMDLIAKGEVPASPTIFRDHVLQLAEQDGAPVKWVPLEPVVANAGQAGLATRTNHPHAALLFIDYLFTDGQKVLEENYYSSPTEPVPFTWWVPEEGLTAAQVETATEAWNTLFRSTFR